MGIPRPKRLPHAGVDRQRLVRCNSPLEIGNCEMVGMKPRILVKVRTYCAKLRSFFHSSCKQLGVEAVKIPEEQTYTTVYDCQGTAESLYRMVLTCPSVVAWQYQMSATVGWIAVGSGEPKEKVKPKNKKRKNGHGEPNGPYDRSDSVHVYGTHGDVRVS